MNLTGNSVAFLHYLREIILRNLENGQFSVEELAGIVGISRSQLHRRVRRQARKTVNEFIREVRLEEAMKLLQKGEFTAAEVAYKTGFSSPSYFNKCFHDQYGYPPGEVKMWIGEVSAHEMKGEKVGAPITERDKGRSITEIVPGTDRSLSRKNKRLYYIVTGLAVAMAAILIVQFLATIKTGFSVDRLIAVLPFHNYSPDPDNAKEIDNSIVLLPLQNISDEENDYLANGVKSEIANNLRNIPDLKVYAGLDVEQLLNNNLTKQEIGKRLGVSNALEGTVWKEKKRFKLSLVLTNLSNNEILWNESYEKEYDQVMDVVSEVAHDLAASIRIALAPEEEQRINAKPTLSVEAYDLNLRAWQKRGEAIKLSFSDSVFKLSNNLARKAIEYDPDFVEPYNLILANEVDVGNIDTAKLILAKTITRFPDNPITYKSKAGLEFYEGDYERALNNYEIAYRLDPDDPWTALQLGRLYCFVEKDFLKGIPLMVKAAELPPKPGTIALFGFLPQVYWNIGDYEKALYWAKRQFNFYPDCQIGNWVFTNIFQGNNNKNLKLLDSICSRSECKGCSRLYIYTHIYNGDFEKAISFMGGDEPIGRSWVDQYWTARLLIESGKAETGLEMMKNLQSEIEPNPKIGTTNIDQTWLLVAIYGVLGEREKAIALLQQYGETKFSYGTLDHTLTDPLYKNLLTEPEYIALCKRMDKEKAEIRAQIKEMEEKGDWDL